MIAQMVPRSLCSAKDAIAGIVRASSRPATPSAGGGGADADTFVFTAITDSYLARSRNAGGKVGLAMCHLFPARELLDYALPIMVAVSVNRRAADGLMEFGQAATGRLSR